MATVEAPGQQEMLLALVHEVRDLARQHQASMEALERRIFRPDQAEGIKSRIRGVVGHENVSPDTDLVIEAVTEGVSAKGTVPQILYSRYVSHGEVRRTLGTLPSLSSCSSFGLPCSSSICR